MKKYINTCKQILLWLSAAIFTGAIYILSDQKGSDSHTLSEGMVREARTHLELPGFLRHFRLELGLSYELILRKIAHFSLFFVLAILLYLAVKASIKKHAEIITIAGCIFLAGMDEYHQIFVTGRTARFSDILIDTAGAASAVLLAMLLTRWVGRRVKKRDRKINY